MATLFNNTEITNAFFNGTELDKIYFNGVLVFEKGGKYLRRIMVGDNLKGKILISDFPTNFKEELINIVSPDVTQVNVISSTNNQSLFFGLYVEKYDSPTYGTPTTYVVAGRVDSNRNLYIYTVEDNYEGINNYDNYQVQSTEDIVISEINDSAIYRHIYIEDENIRPFEVGDIILNTTKIYFSIPDNYFTDIWTSDDNRNGDIVLIKEKGKENVTYPYPGFVSSWSGGEDFKLGAANLRNSGFSWVTNGELYKLDEGTLIKNSSYIIFNELTFIDFNIDIGGEVFNVNKNHTAYPYILVDTRTLGTTGYKRRIMVGDNLKGKTLYGNFLSNLQDYIYIDPDLPGITRSDIKFTSSSRAMEIIDWGFENNYFVDSTQINFEEGGNSILWSNGESYLPKTFSKDKDYIVESISDNPIYRCLLIEDNKIRPLQVGDVVTRNTKFYFTIPDDVFEQLSQGSDDIIILNNGGSISLNASSFSSSIYFKTISGMDTNMNIITIINNKLMVNKSTMQNISYKGDYFEGTVSEVNDSSSVYSMILVDITTLG